MAKRLTAADLGSDGMMDPNHVSRLMLVEVKISYAGSAVTDVLVGGHKVSVPNQALRRAAIEAEMKEPGHG